MTYANWDARSNLAWVACPTCGTQVEMPVEPPLPVTPEERQRFVRVIVVPFARRLAEVCCWAATRQHGTATGSVVP